MKILELKEGNLPTTLTTKVNQMFSILKSIYSQWLFSPLHILQRLQFCSPIHLVLHFSTGRRRKNNAFVSFIQGNSSLANLKACKTVQYNGQQRLSKDKNSLRNFSSWAFLADTLFEPSSFMQTLLSQQGL